MARIAEVAVARLTTPLRIPFVTALRRATALTSVAVRVTDTDGIRGYGEGPQVWRVTGESMESITACVTGPLADVLLGWDPDRDPQELSDALAVAVVGNGGARSACELAVTELAARRAGLPLHRQLGSTAASVASDLTIAADAPDPVMRAQLQEGFGAIKVKVGLADDDVDRLRRIADAAGPGVRLRVDANQAWDVATTVAAVQRWSDAGIVLEFVEQPLPRPDLAGHARLRRELPVPVMLDESVFTHDDLLRAIDADAADLINIKLAKCGGIRSGLAIAATARRNGLGVMVGSMMESRIGVAAAAALAAVAAPGQTHDLDMAWWVADGEPGAYRDGRFAFGDAAGIDRAVQLTRELDWVTRRD